tara:strand:- start:2809 stop:4383 length:1575 start_codon:yes stop_codon:yes gene_type:complete
MKFKDLTEPIIDQMYQIYWAKDLRWDDRMAQLMALTSKSERTVRKWCAKLGFKRQEVVASEDVEVAKSRVLKKSKSYLVTWGQNATKVNKKLLKNMEVYAEHINAEIVVIAGRYHNPTSLKKSAKAKTNDYWMSELNPYLSLNRHDIHKTVSVMSDCKIQATATNPLSGLEGLSKENSCIFGHPKVHMKMIPVLEGYNPKMIMTTGAITKPNYTDSKAGKKSEFHHQYGFVVVEIQNDEVAHIRQVTSQDNGNFYDLSVRVKDGKVIKNDKIEALVCGDMHFGNEEQKVMDATMEIIDVLNPNTVVLHDVFDGYSISHHTMNDPFVQFGLEISGRNDLEAEIDYMLSQLGRFENVDDVVIVRSNHDEHLDKFLKINDWRKLPTTKNSMAYMKYSHMLLNQYGSGNVVGVIPQVINERFPKYKCFSTQDSYRIKGWEVSQHGDIGANGSRGSSPQFRKLNTKLITAHTHSPTRADSHVCVGTTTKLRLSYNKGASGWLQSHAIIHQDGKVQQIHFIGSDKDYTIE